jgi:hypothetical protein
LRYRYHTAAMATQVASLEVRKGESSRELMLQIRTSPRISLSDLNAHHSLSPPPQNPCTIPMPLTMQRGNLLTCLGSCFLDCCSCYC